MSGSKLSTRHAAYDWRRGVTRVECKSGQLLWHRSKRCCYVGFHGVKLPAGRRVKAAFDELWLLLYSPRGVYIFLHDLKLYVHRQGKSTETHGYAIGVYGPRGEDDWDRALDAILDKLAALELVRFVPFDAPLIASICEASRSRATGSAYQGVPLASASESLRGQVLQDLVYAVDVKYLHPTASFAMPEPGECMNGNRRGKNQSPFDWKRGGCRIECKSSQFGWDASHNRWKFHFAHVKLPCDGARDEAEFDELLLALYTPVGVYIYRHDLRLGISTDGKATKVRGHQILLYGPVGEPLPVALETILARLDGSGCERLALVRW